MSKNILKEALADGKALKMAALKNAQNLILENMKEDLKEMVEDQMNEVADDEDTADSEPVTEGEDMSLDSDEDDLDLEEEDEDLDLDSEDDLFADDDEEEDSGLSEADLREALSAALTEVSHGSLGDQEHITPDSHPTGLMDQDKSEKGWEEKTAPAKKDFTVKEAAYRKKIANLVAENTMLRKTNVELRKTVNEVNLFNTKLHLAHKLMNKPGLNVSQKKAIVAKLDEVKSVEQAKNLYESLRIALGALSESAKRTSKASLSEALGVKNAPSQGRNISERKETRSATLTEAVEVNPFSPERMKFLAGIKK
jgi:hypothetical protein